MPRTFLAVALLLATATCKPTPPALSPGMREAMREIEQRARAEEARRPRITTLNDDAWRAIPDDQLDEAVMAFVQARIHGQIGAAKPLAAMPRGFQIFHLSFLVEMEVADGGFNQFFWNSSGDSAPLVPDALRALGADEAASLFEQVRVVADRDLPRRAPFKAQGSLQAFSESYKGSPLNAYDDPFMKLAVRFPALRVAYLKRNAEQFRE